MVDEREIKTIEKFQSNLRGMETEIGRSSSFFRTGFNRI